MATKAKTTKKVSPATKIKNLNKEVKGLSAAVKQLGGEKASLQNTVEQMTEVLRMAEEKQEFEKAWDSANSELGLANWPLKTMALTIDGVLFSVAPRFHSVETVRRIRYDELGKPAGEIAVTSGRMGLAFDLPVFGPQRIYATVTHTEKFPVSGKPAVEIENHLSFDFPINGKVERITVRSNGALEKFDCFIFSDSTEVAAWRGDGEWCPSCNIAHGDADNMSASLTINK